MNDWNYNFNAVSYAAWIRQIEADLKGTPISALTTTWWPDEKLDPLIHPSSSVYEPVFLPDQLFLNPPRISETMDTTLLSPEAVQARLMEALQYGAEDLVLHLSEGKFDATWAKGVHLDMVHIQLEPKEISATALISLVRSLPEGVSIRVPIASFTNLLNDSNPSVQDMLFDHTDRFIITCPISAGPEWMTEMTNTFNSLIHLIGYGNFSEGVRLAMLQRILFCIEGSGEFMQQIIRHRVVHLLWQNLFANVRPSSERLTARIGNTVKQNQAESADHFLIRASMCGLAAALSGVTSLGFQVLPDASGLYRRVSRNIHHLLHLESHMYKGLDPIAGSYVPDHYTRKWTTEIWTSLYPEK